MGVVKSVSALTCYQSFRNEASVSAAWVFLWGAGYMVAQFLFAELNWWTNSKPLTGLSLLLLSSSPPSVSEADFHPLTVFNMESSGEALVPSTENGLGSEQ